MLFQTSIELVQSIKAAVKAAEEDSGVEIKLVNVLQGSISRAYSMENDHA